MKFNHVKPSSPLKHNRTVFAPLKQQEYQAYSAMYCKFVMHILVQTQKESNVLTTHYLVHAPFKYA